MILIDSIRVSIPLILSNLPKNNIYSCFATHDTWIIERIEKLIEKNNFRVLNSTTFHLVHLNTIFQKIVSPIMLLQKLRPKKYRPYLRLIAKKEC